MLVCCGWKLFLGTDMRFCRFSYELDGENVMDYVVDGGMVVVFGSSCFVVSY